ncbi:MAG: DUF5953 family protein [Bacteroidia bacterium]
MIYIYSPSYFEEPALIFRAVDFIDTMLTPYKLEYRLTSTCYEKIENRKEYILEKLKGESLALCNNLPDKFLHLQGFSWEAIERLKSHAFVRTVVVVPNEEKHINIMNSLIGGIGDTMQAYYAEVASPGYMGEIPSSQIMFSDRTVDDILYGLPPVADFAKHGLVDYLFPRFVYWINYWSKEIAETVDFNYERDKNLFHECFQTPSGSWVLRITKDPLDVSIPEHLELLKKVYKRYPKVGRQDLLQ